MPETKQAAELRAIFEKTIGPVPVETERPRSAMAEWDSLRHAELLIALQKQLGVRFSTEEILRANSYAALSEILASKDGLAR